MNVAYCGPLFDYSGYGEANRNTVAALVEAGVDCDIDAVHYTSQSSDLGPFAAKLRDMQKRNLPYDIKILHTTPDQYKRHMEEGKYHIGQFYWETDKVPEDFAVGLRLMDEIWTGSQANVDALKRARVDVPVYVFPQAIDVDRDYGEPFELAIDGDPFVFYSIFEWTDRKNPEALLKAYWEAFQDNENVVLVLKTYFRDFTMNNKRMIRRKIGELKGQLGMKNYPPVLLYTDLMDRADIGRLHATGHVYVSAHRGEGWGVPQAEAMVAGNPIISTGYSGIHEHIESSAQGLLLDYEMVPVSGMAHARKWYSNDQHWAEVRLENLRDSMKLLYENRGVAKLTGYDGQKAATERFSYKAVGKLMKERLEVIK